VRSTNFCGQQPGANFMAIHPNQLTKNTLGQFLRMKVASWVPRRRKWIQRSMLLNIKDVPTEKFESRENRSFRTGSGDKTDDEIVKRAREIGSLTVWRMMRSSRSSRSLWVQLIPFATPADAEITLTNILSGLRGTPLAPRMQSRMVTLDNVSFEEASTYVAIEQNSVKPEGGIRELILAGVVDSYEFGMGFGSAGEEHWTWEEAIPLVRLQIQKIRRGTQLSSHSRN
jgi:hypothetical protein